MVITWYGEGCFRIQNGDRSILLDPIDSSSGLSAPRGKTDAIIKTLTPWPFAFGQNEEGAIIHGAGEYDVQGIGVKGFELLSESTEKFFKTAYVITWEDITTGVLGHMSEDLPPAILENFEEVDVLIGPGGGTPFIDQDRMTRLLKQITPKVFIPSFFKIPGLKRSAGSVTPLLEKVNGGSAETQEKFVFKKKDLDEIKKMQVVCLKT
jgi:L-ascorbate metabolism protein UlaG (beta-lactamase superfamily)